MKKLFTSESLPFGLAIALIYSLLIVPIPVKSQQANGAIQTVQQTTTRADAAVMAFTNVASNTTLTIPAVGNQYFYVMAVDIENVTGTSAAAAATTTVATTNLNGNPTWQMSENATAGVANNTVSITYPTGLKSTIPGTVVTFISPTFATQQTIRVNVYGYYGY